MNPRRDLFARSALPALLIALTMVTAGCTGIGVLGDGDGAGDDLPEDLPYASFDEAVEAPGPAFGPVDVDHPLRLKLVQPSTVEDLPQGETEVWILLYDSSAVEPVTDAEVTIEAFMPMMGHGTSPETDPEHQAEGMYKGSTNFIMGGMWVVNFNVTLADGTELAFAVDVTVAGGMMHHEPPEPKAFDSFEAALNASGVLFDPVNGENLTRTLPFSDSGIQSADYSESHPFTVETAEAAEVVMEVTLTPGPLGDVSDSFTFDLVNADGESEGTVTVSGSSPTGTLRKPVTTVGDWSVDVSGQGFDASYQVNVTLRYELTLKLLDPANPLEALTGQQPFVVLLFDAGTDADGDEVPELNATLNISSWMPDMGHLAEDEVQPEETGNGTYTGFTNHVMAGAWDVNVTVVSDDGWTYEFVLGYQVHEADGDGTGSDGADDHDHADHDHGDDGTDDEDDQ